MILRIPAQWWAKNPPQRSISVLNPHPHDNDDVANPTYLHIVPYNDRSNPRTRRLNEDDAHDESR